MLQTIVILPIGCKYRDVVRLWSSFVNLVRMFGKSKNQKEKALVFLVSVFHMDASSCLFKTL